METHMSIAMPAEDPRSIPNTAVIDPAVITHNTQQFTNLVSDQSALMAVVKADGYGHGMLLAARAAVAGGATWLGAAHPASALALASLKLDVPILAWLFEPRTAKHVVPQCISRSVDISVGSFEMLQQVIEAAQSVELRARVHMKIDTGMGRNGVLLPDVARMGAMIRESEFVELVGAWTHLATADDPLDPMLDEQVAVYDQAIDELRMEAGQVPLQHIAATAGTLLRPDLHRDLVRIGIGLYGYPPVQTDLDLRPAMSLVSRLALVKEVEAGQRIGYGHLHTTDSDTTLGLVPIGYADGLHRAASGKVDVLVREPEGDRRVPQVGRISMDQIVIDLGPHSTARPGDEVVLFGAPAIDDSVTAPVTPAPEMTDDGEPREEITAREQALEAEIPTPDEIPLPQPTGVAPPTAEDWARAAGTISYEVLTSVSARVSRQVAQ